MPVRAGNQWRAGIAAPPATQIHSPRIRHYMYAPSERNHEFPKPSDTP